MESALAKETGTHFFVQWQIGAAKNVIGNRPWGSSAISGMALARNAAASGEGS